MNPVTISLAFAHMFLLQSALAGPPHSMREAPADRQPGISTLPGVDGRGPYGETALMQAASVGDSARVGRLLDEGASVDATDFDGTSSLLRAAARGNAATVEILLHRGAKVDHENDEAWTALMEAAHRGYAETVRVLLRSGARVDLTDNLGYTATDYARRGGHHLILEMLRAASG